MKIDRILTRHPDKTKRGVNIDREKYDAAKAAILETLQLKGGEMTFDALFEAACKKLEKARFEGSPGWYVTTVKLDLEARRVIERVGKDSPQRVRLM